MAFRQAIPFTPLLGLSSHRKAPGATTSQNTCTDPPRVTPEMSHPPTPGAERTSLLPTRATREDGEATRRREDRADKEPSSVSVLRHDTLWCLCLLFVLAEPKSSQIPQTVPVSLKELPSNQSSSRTLPLAVHRHLFCCLLGAHGQGRKGPDRNKTSLSRAGRSWNKVWERSGRRMHTWPAQRAHGPLGELGIFGCPCRLPPEHCGESPPAPTLQHGTTRCHEGSNSDPMSVCTLQGPGRPQTPGEPKSRCDVSAVSLGIEKQCSLKAREFKSTARNSSTHRGHTVCQAPFKA